jgi:hypothetical protein
VGGRTTVSSVRSTAPPRRDPVNRPRAGVGAAPAGLRLRPAEALDPDTVLDLQRLAGNAAVHTLVASRPPAKTRPKANAPTIQRLAVAGTRWGAATSAKISSSGAGGAAIVNDGSGPVVVKTGEAPGPEVLVAAHMFSQVGERDEDGIGVGAPMARIAEGDEPGLIGTTLRRLLPPAADDSQQRRYDDFIDRLDQPYTVVYSFASGKDYQDILMEQKQSKSKKFLGIFKTGKRKVTPDSAMNRLASEPGQTKALGRAAAVDIFTSNRDRLIGSVNLENFKFDATTGTFNFLDNVDLRDSSFLRTVAQFRVDAKKGFRTWATFGRDETVNLANDKFRPIASDVVSNFIDAAANTVQAKEAGAVRKLLIANQPQMERWFAEGLRGGKASVLAVLRDTKSLLRMFAEEDKEMAMTSLNARRYFLDGFDIDSAWDLAEAEARLAILRDKPRWVRGRKSGLVGATGT